MYVAPMDTVLTQDRNCDLLLDNKLDCPVWREKCPRLLRLLPGHTFWNHSMRPKAVSALLAARTGTEGCTGNLWHRISMPGQPNASDRLFPSKLNVPATVSAMSSSDSVCNWQVPIPDTCDTNMSPLLQCMYVRTHTHMHTHVYTHTLLMPRH